MRDPRRTRARAGAGLAAKAMRRRVTMAIASAVGLSTLLAGYAASPVASPASGSPPPASGAVSALPRFGQVIVNAEFAVSGAGVDIDSIAFWSARNRTGSLMFVTSKDLPLVEVWRHPFRSATDQMAPLRHPCLTATARSATNGVLVDQAAKRLYVASNFSPNVCVFSLPDLTYRRTITSGVTYRAEPNLAMLRLPSGRKRLYVSNDTVVYVHDVRTGRKLSQFLPLTSVEAMWGDSRAQVLYIPDETGGTGVYAYRPDGRIYTRGGTNRLGSRVFRSDAEGILEYVCPRGTARPGAGLIVVSDQISNPVVGNDYEVFDRRTWTHLGKLKLRLPGGGYVHSTDGIATMRQTSRAYPKGLFTAHHHNRSVAGVGWGKVFRAIRTQTGRAVGCGR